MTERERAEALLIDMDGVVRVFDPAVAAAIERRHGLAEGAIEASALAWPRLRPAIAGEITHARWLESVAMDLADAAGGLAQAQAAVAEWAAYRGEVAPDVLAFVRAMRASGVPVGLATNATDELDADLDKLGLVDEFDVVINSSAVGIHKPTLEYFAAACAAVGSPPDRCLFVDDTDRHVRGARVAGLSAYRWNGPADLPYLRAALGR